MYVSVLIVFVVFMVGIEKRFKVNWFFKFILGIVFIYIGVVFM